MATITKTKTGWQAVIRIKGWPTQCKTHRIKRDAEDWSRTVEDEIYRGIYIPRGASEKFTLENALDRYTKEVTPTKKPNTQKRELGRAVFLKAKLGKYTLASLTPTIIAGFRDGRLKEGKSNNTVRLELALLSHLFSTAISEWQVGLVYNPVQSVKKPSPGTGRKRRLNEGEEKELLRSCDRQSNPFIGWIVRLALFTAMRKGEILSLTVDQVNLHDSTIFLSDTKNNEVRTVPLSPKALDIINRALDHPLRPKETDLVFYGEPGRDGKRRPYTIDRMWRNVLKLAEMTDFRFHDLRHEATSRFVEAGLSDQEVSSITGHKSMQMLKRYTHLRNKNLVDKLSSL